MKLGRANPSLVAIVAEGFFSRLSFGLVSFALPLYAFHLGLSLPAIGFLASLNLVVALALKPITGAAADRFGLKRSYMFSVVLRSLVSLLLSFATLPWHLFATRGVHGLSIAVRDPAVNALIAEHGGKKAIAQAFAWYQTSKSVAARAGTVVAGLLLTMTGSNFGLVFAVAFVLSMAPLFVVARYVREGDRAAHPATEVAVPAPSKPKGVVKGAGAPEALPFMGLGFLISATAYMLANLFPIFAVEYAGLTAAQAGMIYALGAVAVLAGPGFGWLSDNVSRKLVLSLRSAGNTLSSLIYLVAPNFPGLATGRVVDELGKAAFRPSWGALMAHVASFDKRRRGRTMGYLSAGEDAGEVAGPIVASLIWSAWGVPALLGTRIALALGTEIYSVALTRSLPEAATKRAGRAPGATRRRRAAPFVHAATNPRKSRRSPSAMRVGIGALAALILLTIGFGLGFVRGKSTTPRLAVVASSPAPTGAASRADASQRTEGIVACSEATSSLEAIADGFWIAWMPTAKKLNQKDASENEMIAAIYRFRRGLSPLSLRLKRTEIPTTHQEFADSLRSALMRAEDGVRLLDRGLTQHSSSLYSEGVLLLNDAKSLVGNVDREIGQIACSG